MDQSLPQYESLLPSKDDVARAARLDPGSCPRRYCWWWHVLSFDWKTPVAGGCTFVRDRDAGRVDPNYPQREFPCCRADPQSPADHYEPRGPHLMEDGFTVDRWRQAKPAKPGGGASGECGTC